MTYVAFRVGTYPTVRGYVSGGRDSQPTLGSQLLAGAITGGVGACLFCPIDVVRIRMQADAGTLAAGSTGPPTFRTGSSTENASASQESESPAAAAAAAISSRV